MDLDEKDLKVIKILKKHADLTTSQISKKTGMPITTIHNRIKRLKRLEIIKNYTIKLNYEKLDKPLKAHILITVNQEADSQSKIGKKILSWEPTESVDIVTGTTDLIAQVRIKDMHVLSDFLTNNLRKIEGIDKAQTLMVLEEID
jgi:DNA-binding Lrp family transcriptional regulator